MNYHMTQHLHTWANLRKMKIYVSHKNFSRNVNTSHTNNSQTFQPPRSPAVDVHSMWTQYAVGRPYQGIFLNNKKKTLIEKPGSPGNYVKQNKNQSQGVHTPWFYLQHILEMAKLWKWRKDWWVSGVSKNLGVEGKCVCLHEGHLRSAYEMETLVS